MSTTFGVVQGFRITGDDPILYIGVSGNLQEFAISREAFESLQNEAGGDISGSLVSFDGDRIFVVAVQTTYTMAVMSEMAKKSGYTLTDRITQSDGSAGVMHTPYGEYEIMVRPVSLAKHPDILKKYAETPGQE